MSWRVTLLLVAMATVASFVALRMHAAGPTRTASVAEPVISGEALPIDGVRALRIERPGLVTMTLERRGAAWVETSPFDIAVDPFQVRETIVAARQLRWTRRTSATELETDGTSLESLSLRPPLAKVTFVIGQGADAREITVRLGRVGVAGRAFVQYGDDDDVLVVGQELHQRVITDDLRSWRERSIFPEASVETVEITLRAGDVRTALRRDGRSWHLLEPAATRGDATAVSTLLQSLARAECDGFVAERPDDLSPFGLHAPPGAVTLTWRTAGSAQPTIRTLLVGGPVAVGGSDRYAMIEGRPLVMRISGRTLQSMFAPSTALIDPTGVDGRPEDVRSVTMEIDGETTVAERTPLGWRVGVADGASGETIDDVPADRTASATRFVDELLTALTTTRASAISMQSYPDALHVATLTIERFDGAAPITVRVAVDAAASQWATEAGDGVLRIFPLSTMPPLRSDDRRVAPPRATAAP